MPNLAEVEIRQWRPCLEDATVFHEVLSEATPIHNHAPPEETLVRMPKMIAGIEDGALLAWRGGRVVGAVALSIFQKREVARMVGGVIHSARGTGVGKALLERVETVARFRGCESLRAQWFLSDDGAVRFMQKVGFEEHDRVFWSRFELESPVSSWALEKQRQVEASGIRMVTGEQFEDVRGDWDRAWWRLIMTSLKDVPSRIPFQEIPFEKWRPFLELPFTDRSRTLVALDGVELVGLLSLSEPKDGAYNIGTTNVAKHYRRRGVSTALKCGAVHLAQSWNGACLTTQNHERNPMFSLNRNFGFVHFDTHIDGVMTL